jgi:hypothetical protein
MQEGRHHVILNRRLEELGFKYGDFPVHEQVWLDCLKTKDSILERLAFMHCTIEARGIDVTRFMTIPRFRKGGDDVTADLLEHVVLRDEIDHVKKGLDYFKLFSETVDNEPLAIRKFRKAVRNVVPLKSKGPYAAEERLLSGLTPGYYTYDEEKAESDYDSVELRPKVARELARELKMANERYKDDPDCQETDSDSRSSKSELHIPEIRTDAKKTAILNHHMDKLDMKQKYNKLDLDFEPDDMGFTTPKDSLEADPDWLTKEMDKIDETFNLEHKLQKINKERVDIAELAKFKHLQEVNESNKHEIEELKATIRELRGKGGEGDRGKGGRKGG